MSLGLIKKSLSKRNIKTYLYQRQIPQTTDGLLRHDRVFLREIAKPVQADQGEGQVGEHYLAEIIVFDD